jgi:hypothetical protein
MVAFAFSVLLTILSVGVIVWYARRRPQGQPVTWGEAMVAATFVFWIMFLVYGIVPHQWLTYADNELGWRQDKILVQSGDFGMPFTVTYLVIRDLVAVAIYGIGLAGHVALWMLWQNRGKEKPKELPTSAYGRPLVKPGAEGSA